MNIKIIAVSVLFLALQMFSQQAQSDEVAKAVALGQIVELTKYRESNLTDFQVVSVNLNGKLLKKFSSRPGISLNVIATFKEMDAEYLVLRTFVGQGACVEGDIYALKFYSSTNSSQPSPDSIRVDISPVLTACMGEDPVVTFTRDKGSLAISVGTHTLRGPIWNQWVIRK